PLGIFTTSTIPGKPTIEERSKEATSPPKTGHCFTAAWARVGKEKSRPKVALPSILERFSTRPSGFPSRVHSFSLLSAGLAGGLTLAAASTRSPKRAVRREVLCTTFPDSVRQVAGSTFHFFAAAAINISRALAPIWRINSKKDGVLSLFPVNCQLMRGLR